MLTTLVNSSTGFTIGLADSPLMERAQDFYKNLVGLELKVDEANRKVLVSEDSRFSLTLRLSKDAPTQSQIDELKRQLDCTLKSTDWRSLASHISLKTPQLNDLIQSLRSSGHSVELFPNELFPTEAYTLDPVGNLIGFTCGENAMTLKPSPAILDKKVSAPAPDSLTMSTSPSSQNSSSSTLRNIAVMTSGGDAPGMNAFVRAVVRTAIFKGCNAYAVMEGYEGLIRGGSDHIKRMMWQDVECYLADGGTNIGTARCMAFRERLGRLKACKHMIEAGIDVLIVCGGDGSLTGADLFRSEWPSLIKELSNNKEISQTQYERHKHLNICGTIGSIDNDMATTDATIGAYSSLDRICKAIDYIGATAKSHSRAFVVEVMGRNCGWLALMAGIACSADYIFIPEKPAISKDWQQQMCDVVSKHRAHGKRKTIVIVAEGAITNDLAHISAKEVKDVLVGRLGLDTRVTTLGHVQRGGTAVAFDRILATLQGVEAVNAVLESTPSTPSPLIGIKENQIVRLSLVDAVRITKSVADAIDRHDFEGAMALRDADFTEHLLNFMSMNSAIHEEPTLPVEKRKRIAIINVGAPAGGMNSAILSMATFCMSRGHVPYAIHNGFCGLAKHESVRSIDWLEIQCWTSMGGSEIGTNRATPEETDIGMIAYYFEKYKFDGLILVGGFEAFTSLHQLESARAMYPSFRIPMVLIPATISNNVPGTDYSLGADTCLNSLMNYCDIFKQSASATRNRAFVIEVQGGNSGYIATYASLACGAFASYVPEEGIDLAQLELDVQAVRKSFSSSDDLGKSGTLILKSTNASKLLTAQVLADIFKLEGKYEFDAKTAIPGHVQQGGLPSPIDRTRASRFAVKAVQFIETSCDVICSTRAVFDFPVESQELIETAAVLGVKGSHLKFTSIRQLYDYETEHGNRMPKTISWNKTRKICDRLVGRVRLESC